MHFKLLMNKAVTPVFMQVTFKVIVCGAMCGDVRYCICRSFKTLDNVKLSAMQKKKPSHKDSFVSSGNWI